MADRLDGRLEDLRLGLPRNRGVDRAALVVHLATRLDGGHRRVQPEFTKYFRSLVWF